MHRELPIHSVPPKLNYDLIERISTLCFQETDHSPSEALFIFGTWSQYQTWVKHVKWVLDKKIAPLVFINGGIPLKSKEIETHAKPAADRILEYINLEDYPKTQFIVEKTARHTLEEVQKSFKLYDFSKLKTISYIAKSHAATRQMLTLKKYAPKALFRPLPYDVKYPDESNRFITKNNWAEGESAYRVWAQFLRIKKYGERGDIAYPVEIKKQVDYIIDKTGYVFE